MLKAETAGSFALDAAGSDLRKKLEARKVQSSRPGQKLPSYAKLEGPHVRHYVRTVCVTLGRQRDSGDEKGAEDDAGPAFSPSFVSLGTDKAISNTHLQIFWDFRKREWVLICLGRNGATVNGQRLKMGDGPISLKNKARVQVPNGLHFFFLNPHAKASSTKKKTPKPLPPSASPAPGVEAEKPSQSFAELIAEAILSSADDRMAVGEIYQHIKDNHPYYRSIPDGTWQSSIRHSLTSNKSFLKTSREHAATLAAPPSLAAAISQKGVCWTLRPEAQPEVLEELRNGGDMSVLTSKTQRDRLLHSATRKPPTPALPSSLSRAGMAPRPVEQDEVLLSSFAPQPVARAAPAPPPAAPTSHAEEDEDELDSDEGDGGMVIDE